MPAKTRTKQKATTKPDGVLAKKSKPGSDEVFFDKLPNELVIKFLECLSSVDRHKFLQVARRFSEIIKANHHLQRKDIPSLIIAKDGVHVRTQEGRNIKYPDFDWLKKELNNVDIEKLVKWSGALGGFHNVKFMTKQLMEMLKDKGREISIHRFECHLIEDQADMRMSDLLRTVNPRELLLHHYRPGLAEILEIPPRCEKLILETEWSYWQHHDLAEAARLKWVKLGGYDFYFAAHSTGHFDEKLLRRLKERRMDYYRLREISQDFYNSFLEIGFRVQRVGAAFEIICDKEEFL